MSDYGKHSVDPSKQYQVPASQSQMSPNGGAPSGKSGLGIASLVIGIIALLTSFLPIINNFSALMAVVGLILGIIGMVMISRKRTGGKGITLAAIILNILAFVIVLASQAMYVSAIDEAFNGKPSSGASSTTSSASSAAASSTPAYSGRYAVSIDDAKLTSDYDGSPAIVVTYTWTNNSDKDNSFMAAISDQAFQNGVELEYTSVPGVDTSSQFTDLKPGATTTTQAAFKLNDTSDVTIECSEFISFNDAIIAEKTFSLA